MSSPIDQQIRLRLNTYSDAGQTVPADPTTVAVDISDPAGVTTTFTWANAQVVHDSTGVFHLDYTPATAGHYRFHWKTTGTVTTAQDGWFDVDAEFTNVTVSPSDFATYLNNQAVATDSRAQFILDLAQQLCETIVNPLPAGANTVILDVAERAYANPVSVGGSIAMYAEGEGPFSDNAPGTSGGGLYLTQNNKATLRRLNGAGGAFTIDTMPATAGTGLPWWDQGVTGFGTWDSPT